MTSLTGQFAPLGLPHTTIMDQDGDTGTVTTLVNGATTTGSVTNTMSGEATFPPGALKSWQHNIGGLTSPPPGSTQVVSYSDFDYSKVHCLIFAVSNNMIDRIGFGKLRDVWIYLRQTLESSSTYILLRMMQGSYSKSVWWKFLQGAIEAGDARGCAEVIRLGQIKVDDVVCRGSWSERYTTVELAVLLRHTNVLRVLLDEGADPALTQSYTRSRCKTSTWGALHLAAICSSYDWSTYWEDCYLKDRLYRAASILLSTEAWAKTDCSVTLTFDLHSFSGLQDLEALLDATSPHTPTELALAMIHHTIGSRPEARYEFRPCANFLMRLLELIVLNPRRSLPFVIQPQSPSPLCLGQGLFSGKVEISLQYLLNRTGSATRSFRTCPCGKILSDCLSTWFDRPQRPPTILQQSHGADTQLAITEILRAIGSNQPSEQMLYRNSVLSVCKPGWHFQRVEDELLETALKTHRGDLVQRLLTVRQTHLNLEEHLQYLVSDNDTGHLVELLLAARLTTTVLPYLGVDQEMPPSFVIMEALVRHDFLLRATLGYHSQRFFKTAAGNGDCVRLCHYLELHPTLTIHDCIEMFSKDQTMGNFDKALETLFEHRSTRQALVNTARVGRALIAAARRGWINAARRLLTSELSAAYPNLL